MKPISLASLFTKAVARLWEKIAPKSSSENGAVTPTKDLADNNPKFN